MLGLGRVLHVPGADADANAGDRSYLVLAKPNVIINDVRLRGLAVAGSDAAGRKSPHNHAQTVRNLRRAPCGMRPLVPGLSKLRVWTASLLPMSQHRSPLPWKSFTGASAALIDVSDPTRDAGMGLTPTTGNKCNRATAVSWSIH